ncbi:MAG: glycoside hydrolase 43 family protein [Lachnospiraceae bacterium]|nr:glycoside hydrolase 43 family protein [Lachnospiraceae bacterium]
MYYECDLGDGRYRNPILFADYSDPDVIRVGDTYYMTASSFNYTPGLPILISRDLLHWELAGYALERVEEAAGAGLPHEESRAVGKRYEIPRHSAGVWAPAIRYHEGEFFIFYGMPDEGCYMVKTKDPLGKWEKPVCIRPGKGFIDTCPFWDDDGKAYIVHAYAKSRIGFKSRLGIFELSPDGTRALSEDAFIFDGNDPADEAVTIEGPKIMKRDGWYYILAPAGGVRQGWQLALRSRDIRGPYEHRVVMRQGKTVINGPHQGALVDTVSGEEWFLHFQDRGLYGRILHMQPAFFKDGWPVFGEDPDNTGCGQPVYAFRKPETGASSPGYLTSDDSFPGGRPGLIWQWLGNPAGDPLGRKIGDGLRLKALNLSGEEEPILWHSSNVLTQKLVLPEFVTDVVMDLSGLENENRAGAVMMGGQYALLYAERDAEGRLFAAFALSEGGDEDKREKVVFKEPLPEGHGTELTFRFVFVRESRAEVGEDAEVRFQDGADQAPDLFAANVDSEKPVLRMFFSRDGQAFTDSGCRFVPEDHTWVGAKIGVFALSKRQAAKGYADVLSVKTRRL